MSKSAHLGKLLTFCKDAEEEKKKIERKEEEEKKLEVFRASGTKMRRKI